MATVQKRNGKWRVQIPRHGHALCRTFHSKADADEWAREAEHAIDREVDPSTKRVSRKDTFASLIDLHIDDMHAVGKPLRRSKLSIGVQYGVPFCTPIDKVLAEIVRHRFAEPVAALRELFGRLVFNILCGNTDDHARNHAAFWDGKELRLTPAYDLCPQSRSGQIASQAMLIAGDARFSQLTHCLKAAGHFLLSTEAATGLIAKQVETIKAEWAATCDAADLSQTVRALFWGRQFLNPYAFEGLGAEMGRPAS